MEPKFNEQPVTDLDSVSTKLRRGYIFGQEAYDADHRLDSHPDEFSSSEVSGFKMGWQSRYIADMCGLQPSAKGLLNGGGRPNDVGPI